MSKSYDVLVIGGGHNGLVAAAYLAKAGQRVLVLERRTVPGGATATEEAFPGFRFSACSYVCSMMDAGVMRDLDLAAHGLKLLPVDPAVFAPHPDGRSLLLWTDVPKAQAEIRKLSEKDAAAYGEMSRLLMHLAEALRPLLYLPPPAIGIPPLNEAWELLKIGRGVKQLSKNDLHQLMRIAPMAMGDFVGEYFETELLRAVVASSGIWGVPMGPWSAGTTAAMLYQIINRGGVAPVRTAGLPVGGMGAVATALASAARKLGVEIRTGADVARIDVAEGGTSGVTLASGESIRARAVVSNADPKRTFLNLLSPDHLGPSFTTAVRNTRAQGCVAKVNLALSELPSFTALPGNQPGPQHRAQIHIGPDVDYLERAFDDWKYGRWSKNPYLDVLIPTVTDPSLAPAGKHVMSVFVQFAPYQLREGDWSSRREEFGDHVVDALAAYAPNLKPAIMHRQVITPLDLERDYGLTGGSIFHADLAMDQLYIMRPVAGFARYRGPIARLYLCGAGTHPGGGVTGIPGANAAREVLKDLRAGRL